MQNLLNGKYYWKDNGLEKTHYTNKDIKILNRNIDVCIYHFGEGTEISKFTVTDLCCNNTRIILAKTSYVW
jgi:hypothetical protein